MPEVSSDDLKNMSPDEIAELQKQNCIFCKIASKEVPAKILHEDDDTICILDINPASEGHILVFPKQHYMILPHIPDDIIGKLFDTVKLMSNTLLKTLQTKGTNVFVANGVAAGQKAPHVLIHVFPRKDNDGLLELPSYDVSDEQLQKIKSSLKPYLNKYLGSKEVQDNDSHTEKKINKKDNESKENKSETRTIEHARKKEHENKDKVIDQKPENKPSNSDVDLDDI